MKDKLINYYNDIKSELPEFLGLERQPAMHYFEQTGFPNSRMEKWQKSVIRKFTDKTAYSINDAYHLEPEVQWTEDEHSICIKISRLPNENKTFWKHESGAVLGSLRFGAEEFPAIFSQHFNKYARHDLNGFTAVNTALTDHGYFLYFPKGTSLDKPIYLSVDNTQSGQFQLLRNLIILDDQVSATFIQSDLTRDQFSGFQHSITEVFVGNNSHLRWFIEQDHGKDSGAVNNIFVHQDKNSECTILNASIRGGMIRNEVHVRLNEEGSTSNVYGVYLPGTGEQVDNQVFIDHAFPNCQSNELFKGVLNGEGTSVFNGHILVRQDAQKTNAYQKNRNILLSDAANAYAKPFLEIYADDVKCSHGATIGQLDENALFYLQSRGLSIAKAKEFLVKAFLGEILDICGHEVFKRQLEEKIEKKLHE
ncbi:MAG TPA: Fe-S cluster assembly protein SufD [Saprospirales bacterium]|nr:Fe-S cluster assembly protein SufD [Saprospirales bacterium]HAY71335.1 Fe-S cluster assembly protein SufD [Saprospirales bacterium]HRQ29836.1 Fe-S cluster assembly protein SufD [Saprospiraceae bacterium]